MIAVPPNPAAHMQQNLRQITQNGRNLVRDAFGRMEMAGVEAEQLLVLDRVAQVKLVRADNITFRSNAEEFSLHRIQIQLRIDRFGEYFIERSGENFARSFAVGRRI